MDNSNIHKYDSNIIAYIKLVGEPTDRQTDIATYRAAITAKNHIEIISDIVYNNKHNTKTSL